MNELPLAYAFGAGLIATLNPCGFAMLPSFIAFYVGTQEPDYEKRGLVNRVGRALGVGGLVTAGFLTVFLFFGLLFSLGLRFFFAWVPYLTLVIALGLILLGVFMLFGRTISVKLPRPGWAVRQKGKLPVYLYGVTYAVASLSCTLPVFLIVVGTAAVEPGPLASLVMFSAYGSGMATILVGVTLGAALFKGVVGNWLRTFIPYLERVSAILLVTMGLYMVSLQLPYTTGLDLSLILGGNSPVTSFLSENLFLILLLLALLAATVSFLVSKWQKQKGEDWLLQDNDQSAVVCECETAGSPNESESGAGEKTRLDSLLSISDIPVEETIRLKRK